MVGGAGVDGKTIEGANHPVTVQCICLYISSYCALGCALLDSQAHCQIYNLGKASQALGMEMSALFCWLAAADPWLLLQLGMGWRRRDEGHKFGVVTSSLPFCM